MKHLNWYRRAVTSCLALSLTFSGFVYATASPNDVMGHWAEKQLTDWQTKGFIHGYEDGSIKPDNSISRAEFITLVNKAFNFAEEAPISYTDVKKGNWYYSEVAKAKAAGYLSGYENRTIRPNDKISRQEVAVILAKLARLDTERNKNAVANLLDSLNIPQWSKGSINEVLDKGIMKGYPNQTFQPESPITRSEAVVALDNVMRHRVVKIFDKAGTYEPSANSQTIDGDVNITASDVTLKNTVINGNLILDKAIGDGEINLQSVTVKGTLFVQGSGEKGVYLVNSTINNIIVNKENRKVGLIAEGKTSIKSVDLQSGAKLEESDLLTGQTGFADVTIESTVPSSATVTLAGDFSKVNVGAPKVALSVEKGNISDFNVASTAADAKINLANGVKVSTFTLDAKVSVTGLGSIGTAKVNVSGSKFSQTPASIQKANSSITVQVPVTITDSDSNDNDNSTDTTLPQTGEEPNVVKTFDKAGTYGPIPDCQTVDGDVKITASGVILQNTVITGSLTLDKAIADGDVYLKNVTVKGTLLVEGGGEHSIHLIDSTINNVIVNKADGKVRLVAEGTTTVQSVDLQSGAKLEESNLFPGQSGFTDVKVESTVSGSATVTLSGDFSRVNVGAAQLALSIEKGTVSDLSVASTAMNTKVNLADGVKVSTLTLDAKVSVTGKGSIEAAKVNVSGSTFEQAPANIQKGEDVTVQIGDLPVVHYTFTGFDGFQAGVEKGFCIKATASNVPADKKVKYEATLMKDGVAVSGQKISYQDATGAWQTFTTNEDGVAYFGPADGFKPADIGLDQGITTNFKATVKEAGNYSLKVKLVDAASGGLVGEEGSQDFTVVAPAPEATPTVTYEFTGFDGFQAGVEKEFSIKATALNIPADKKVKYEATLMKDGVAVSGQVISYEDGTGAWQTFTTNEDGVAYFGPADGFKPADIGLDQGITTNFKATVKEAGEYSLKVKLVDAASGELVGDEGDHEFTVAGPVVDYEFTQFDGFQAGVEKGFCIKATALNVPADKKVKYEATLMKDGVAVSGQVISYQDAPGVWHTFTTNEDGVAQFGPADGFKPSNIDLDKGVTTKFKMTIKHAGQYNLRVKLVDAKTGEIVGQEGSKDFTVKKATVAPPITVISSGFGNNQVILIKYRGHGYNVNLPISWSTVDDAKSYAIVMYDPDADQSVHWAVINTNLSAKGLLKALELFNNDEFGYSRPKSQKGNKYSYKVIVYAIDSTTINISQHSNITKDELEKVLFQNLITKGELTGTYSESPSPSISSVNVTEDGAKPTIHVTTDDAADGTPVKAELVSGLDGSSLAIPVTVKGTILNNSASLQLRIPANLSAGNYKINVEVGKGSTQIVDSSAVYSVKSGSMEASTRVQTVPTVKAGYKGEVTQLVIKSDSMLTNGDEFIIKLPQGVTWNSTYTTDGTLTGAAYHMEGADTLRFTVTGNPTELTIPISVQIANSCNGQLNLILDASTSSSIPSQTLTFAVAVNPSDAPPSADNITVTNNPEGTSDTIVVNGLISGDIVKVYNDSTGGTLLGQSGAVQEDQNLVTVTVQQLGKTAGKVYVSVVDGGSSIESSRTEKAYDSEPANSGNATITVANVPMLNDGFSGEATTLVLNGNFNNGDLFNVILPLGVTWNSAYATVAKVTGATVKNVSSNGVQLAVSGNPTQIRIPLNVQIDSTEAGNLYVTVNAQPGSSIPSVEATFATLAASNSQPTPTIGETESNTDYTPINKKVIINGHALDATFYEKNGSILAPIRSLAEGLGIGVDWDNITKQVKCSSRGKTLVFTMDSNWVDFNGRSYLIDEVPVIINDRSYVPIKYVVKAFGGNVTFGN